MRRSGETGAVTRRKPGVSTGPRKGLRRDPGRRIDRGGSGPVGILDRVPGLSGSTPHRTETLRTSGGGRTPVPYLPAAPTAHSLARTAALALRRSDVLHRRPWAVRRSDLTGSGGARIFVGTYAPVSFRVPPRTRLHRSCYGDGASGPHPRRLPSSVYSRPPLMSLRPKPLRVQFQVGRPYSPPPTLRLGPEVPWSGGGSPFEPLAPHVSTPRLSQGGADPRKKRNLQGDRGWVVVGRVRRGRAPKRGLSFPSVRL